ncbi:TIGR02594 family protein [Shewanella submarina]|uniref:TIGR02594 family protein n=1 Tax=Shewanella submarina TaxID=2016376 RepID=A0ABV7GFV9_9GAMM|nr:TIGR02594 family protein [Shewanella submarina]MCL1037988.1 TIGR02594 family protein [Shewanella submarina]
MMDSIQLTAFDLATRFTGIKEIEGFDDNPQIMAMLKLDNSWPENDEVPWCSAFTNYIAWLLRLPRSKSLRARSWLKVGIPIPADEAEVGFDVVILKRGKGAQPGPDVIKAPGHVGFFAGFDGNDVLMLGGNQSDEVNVGRYPASKLLGIRRL